jgi:H+/gluconate symporter-like permease
VVDVDVDDKETLIARGAGLAVALGAAWIAQQVVGAGWKAILGHKPPKPEDEGDARFGEIAVAALITGAVVGLARVLATRGAARFIK